MAEIINLQLGRIAARVNFRHGVPFTYDQDVVKLIASRCTEPESGGRMIDAILTNTLLPDLSGQLLNRMLAGDGVTKVHVRVEGGEFAYDLD
jgi:type VI secretion system protein VasG